MAQASDSSGQKTIVVVGGSYSGISASHYILKHVVPMLASPKLYRVMLISSSTEVLARPACPRAMLSDDFFPQEKLFVNIAKCFEQYPSGQFEFVHGTATKVDLEGRLLSVQSPSHPQIPFHALIIATGASTPSPLLGLNDDAAGLRAAWSELRAALPQAKNIVVAGGGPAGVETAAELAEFLNGPVKLFQLQSKPAKANITLVTSAGKLLPVLRPNIAQQAEKYLAKLGVTVIKNTKCQETKPEGSGTTHNLTSKTTIQLSDGKTIEADLYIPATGTRPNTSFLDSSLLSADGRVKTDVNLRVEATFPRIYAVGDASSAPRPAIHNILTAVPVLCNNVKRDLIEAEGGNAPGQDRPFNADERESQMVLLGQQKGVGAAMGWHLPSFLVRSIKRDYWLWTTSDIWTGAQWKKAT